MRRGERKGRRKQGLPEGSCLGHTVKSRMTVIIRWSAIVLPKPVSRQRYFKVWDAGHLR